MRNYFRPLAAALVLSGSLLWLTPAPAVAQDDGCLPLALCVYIGPVKVCVETCI